MQFDYDHLRALSAILRFGSFDAAAADLGVTASAISQRIRALENRVGARLILRGTPCRGTELGQRLARHMEDVALMEAQFLPAASGSPRITIALNADSLDTWIMPALAAPRGLRIDLRIEDQDHSTELLKSGEAVAAITARAVPVQGCDVLALGGLGYTATASPEFAAEWFANGVDAASLQVAPALIFSSKDALQSDWAAREAGRDITLSGHIIPSTTAFVDAAVAGLGWGLNPDILVRDHLAAGRLVSLGANPHLTTPLYWQYARRMQAPLATLTSAIRRTAKAHLVALPSGSG